MFGFFGGQENKRLDDIIKNFNVNNIVGTFSELIDYFKQTQNTVEKTKTSLELNIDEHKIIYDKIIKVIAEKKDENGNFIYKNNNDIAYHPFFKHFLISLIGVNYHASEHYSIIELKEENIKKKFNGFYTCECIFNTNNYNQLRGHIERYYKNDIEIVNKFGDFIGQNINVETLIINIKKMQVLSLIDLCNVKRTEKVTEIKEIEKIITKTVTEKGEPAKPYIPQEIIDLLNAKLGESFDIKQLELSEIEEKIEKEERKENDISKKSKKLPKPQTKQPSQQIKLNGDYLKNIVVISRKVPPFGTMQNILSNMKFTFSSEQLKNMDTFYKASNDNAGNYNADMLKNYINKLKEFSMFITKKLPQINNESSNTPKDLAIMGEKQLLYGETIKYIAGILEKLVADYENHNFKSNETVADRLKDMYNQDNFDKLIEALENPNMDMTNQIGGSQQYHKKYLKYKAKYMQLKNN